MRKRFKSIFGSVFAKVSLILLSMGAALAAAIGVGWVVFETVNASVNELQKNSLPRIEASTGLVEQATLVRDQFQVLGNAKTSEEVEQRSMTLSGALDSLNAAVSNLDEQQAQEFSAYVARLRLNAEGMATALSSRFEARTSLESQLNWFQVMVRQASNSLEKLGDNAVSNLNEKSEETIGTVRSTLTSLTDKEFVEITHLLGLRAELNLLTGMALASQSTRDPAMLAVMNDIANSALTRLNRALDAVLPIGSLTEQLAPVVQARDYIANTSRTSIDRASVLRLRQESDAALSEIMDDRLFSLTILGADVSDQNESAIRSLIEQEVSALQFASEMDIAVKELLLAAVSGANADAIADVEARQATLTEQASRLEALAADNRFNGAFAASINQIVAFADVNTGLLASRLTYLAAADEAANQAANAGLELVAMAGAAQDTATAALGDVLKTSDTVSQSAAQGATRLRQITLAGVAITFLSFLATWAFILRPLSGVTRVTERLSSGDLAPITGFERQGGEIGRLATALSVFRDSMIERQEFEAAEREREEEARKKEEAENAKRRRAEEEAAKRQEQQEAEARAKSEAERQEMIASLSKSLGAVVSAASAGDFSKRVDVDFADDKLVALASDVNTLIENVEGGINAAGSALERVAHGDLTEEMGGRFQGAFKDLQDNMNAMIKGLKDLIGGISGSTENLAQSSMELRDTSEGLSKQAEQNAASLEETSGALEQLSTSIKQIDKNISEANQSAQTTSDAAKKGQAVASEAADAMTRIHEASEEISSVVSVINDISFQINLLALNAGVEAARAGDAGRGFAVVASEVRQLSHRASEASNEIAAVMSRSDLAVADGVAKVKDAGSSLEKIAGSVVEVSDSIEVIARAISEQVSGVSDINSAVAQIDQNTQRAAASFEEVTAASALLSGEANTLRHATSRFKTSANVIEVAPHDAAKAKVEQTASTRPPVNGNLAELPDDWEDF